MELTDLPALTAKAKEVLAGDVVDFNHRVKFDFGDVGKLFIDGENGIASNEDEEADATLTMKWDNFKKLAEGKLDPAMAFFSGRLKVSGDMFVFEQLKKLLHQFGR